jgi:DNA polymerase III subunit gamma/tau
MDKFIVSARKYRPQTFNTVVGQAHITTTLKNAIKQNQLAHAFLFCGPRGVGKTTCARILAKTINCENQTPEGEACNTCHSCISFNQGSSLNIHELDAASNNSVDDIRTLVEQVRFVPQAGKYKVYIIDEVHMLSSAAFNAFLKTLEEPPPYAIFILATTEKHKILPTILSRCQIFDFKRITTNDSVEHMQEICEKEGIKSEKAALQTIAQKSEGCMRDALSIMDKIASFSNGEITYTSTLEHLNILDEDYYFQLLNYMVNQDLAGAMLLYDDINRKGFEGDLVINGFAEFIRNLLISKDEKIVALLDVVENFRAKYVATSKQIHANLLLSALNILNEAEINYRAARNKRLHVELAIIKLCYLKQALQLTTGEISGKKKITDKAITLPFRHIQPFAVNTKSKKETAEIEKLAAKETAKLIIAEEPQQKLQPAQKPESKHPVATVSGDNNKISSIEKIRKQFYNTAEIKENKALEENALKEAWAQFIQRLKEAKSPAAESFERASLKIVDENSFFVKTSNTIEFQFVNSTKTDASEFLQKELCNSGLQFFITKEENKEIREQQNRPLTSVQQFQRMIEKYPFVKELKEKLKMDLDR